MKSVNYTESFKNYIGSKLIKARPQKSVDGQDGYEVMYPDGYVSWSPKDVFEQAYSELPEKHVEFLNAKTF